MRKVIKYSPGDKMKISKTYERLEKYYNRALKWKGFFGILSIVSGLQYLNAIVNVKDPLVETATGAATAISAFAYFMADYVEKKLSPAKILTNAILKSIDKNRQIKDLEKVVDMPTDEEE